MTRAPIIGFALTALLGGCLSEEVNRIGLDIEPTGFRCTEEYADGTQHLLIERAITGPAANGTISLVVDYLSFDGLPSCNTTLILRACEEGCPLVHRDCTTIEADEILARIEGAVTEESLYGALLAELRAQPPITEDAPDGVVSIRVVATTESCEDVMGTGFPLLKCAQLLGCAYSCPGQLDAIEGEAQLFFDTLARDCGETEVAVCASLGVPGSRVSDPATWCAP